MRFVNMSSRPAYSKFTGPLGPGEVSSDGGPFRTQLEKALSDVVNICGTRLGIRLNEREADLLDKVLSLDEKGCGFKKESLPEEVRNDPDGMKKAERMEDEAQKRHLDELAAKNAENAKREAEINGEILERKPKGPATMEGKEVEPPDLKSGFEKIMEENAKIAAEKPKMDVNEALDPVGAHAKGNAAPEKPAEPEAFDTGKAPAAPKRAANVQGDVARNADAKEPDTAPQNPKNAMDRQAAEMAKGLSVLSALNNPPAAKGKGRGKAGKKTK